MTLFRLLAIAGGILCSLVLLQQHLGHSDPEPTVAAKLLTEGLMKYQASTRPTQITFEWTNTREGSNAKQVRNYLQAASFEVHDQKPFADQASQGFKMRATWTGTPKRVELLELVSRIERSTLNEGIVMWHAVEASTR